MLAQCELKTANLFSNTNFSSEQTAQAPIIHPLPLRIGEPLETTATSDITSNPSGATVHIGGTILGKETPTIDETIEVSDTETTMIYFSNGDEATSIPELATLMEENPVDTANMLFYQGHVKEALEGAGETALAEAAVAAVNQFSRDHHAGVKAMVAVLRRKIKFAPGSEATDPEQLADLMDQDWNQAESLLYKGIIAFWLRYTNQETALVEAAEEVVVRFSEDRYTGVKAMVAVLRRKIKFALGSEATDPEQLANLMDQDPNQAQKHLYKGVIAFWLRYTNQETALVEAAEEIERYNDDNKDRGLEELIQRLAPQIEKPKPEVSPSKIDFGNMKPKHQKTISLKIKNIGRGFLHGNVRLQNDIPGLQISNTEIQKSGTVTVILDARELKVKQEPQASLVLDTNGGIVEVPISWHVTYPIQQSIRQFTINGILMAAVALVIRLITQKSGISGWLASHIALDKLFYLGFELPAVTVWALWGFVGGIAIQGYREMQIPGRKVIGFLFAFAPLLLLGIAGVIRIWR